MVTAITPAVLLLWLLPGRAMAEQLRGEACVGLRGLWRLQQRVRCLGGGGLAELCRGLLWLQEFGFVPSTGISLGALGAGRMG